MTEDDVRRIALQAILDCFTMPDPTPEQRRIDRPSEQFVPVKEAAERLLAEYKIEDWRWETLVGMAPTYEP